jgi:hypothetical protein
LAQVRQSIDWLQKVGAEMRTEAAELRRETEKRQAAAAERRRLGEDGPDWKILQQRIDLGRTTYLDVITGLDGSKEAKRVRQFIADGLPKVKESFDAAVVEDADGSYAELQRTFDSLERR